LCGVAGGAWFRVDRLADGDEAPLLQDSLPLREEEVGDEGARAGLVRAARMAATGYSATTLTAGGMAMILS
jgi:hypothetical protein